jgi:hypothetical protein
MRKSIKKLGIILFRILSVVVFLLLLAFLLIQQKRIQTAIAHKTSLFLSNKLNTTVRIGSLDFDLFRNIILTEVYIQDLHKDTLFYAKKMKFGIEQINLKKQRMIFSDVTLLNAKSKIIKYKQDDDYNYQFIIDAFDSKDTTQQILHEPWVIDFNEVTCVNTDFSHINQHEDFKTTGINYFDLRVQHINGRISDIRVINDSINASINYLAAVEKSGFIINSMSSHIRVSGTCMVLNSLNLKTPYSNINTDLRFDYNHYRDYLHFNTNVTMKAKFVESEIEMADIAYFAPYLKGVKRKLIVTGKVNGSPKYII